MTQGASKPALVMIIEDDPDVRESLMELLEDHDYAPLGAAHGRDALEQLRALREKPRVILLDLMMPVMDGLQFRAAQRADPDLRGIPVVILSAHLALGETAADLAAEAVLKKPVPMATLLETLAQLCTPDAPSTADA